jgi:hypothetical protein
MYDELVSAPVAVLDLMPDEVRGLGGARTS